MTTKKRTSRDMWDAEISAGGDDGGGKRQQKGHADEDEYGEVGFDSSEEEEQAEVGKTETSDEEGGEEGEGGEDNESDGEDNEKWGRSDDDYAAGDGAVRLEAFSMEQELRRGRFNEAGVYIPHGEGIDDEDEEGEDGEDEAGEDDDDDDGGLYEEGGRASYDGLAEVDAEGMARAEEAQREAQREARREGQGPETYSEEKDALRVLCEQLRDGETAGRCLQRLYAVVKRGRTKGREGARVAQAAAQAAAEAIDAVTDSVAVLEARHGDALGRSRAAWASLRAQAQQAERDLRGTEPADSASSAGGGR